MESFGGANSGSVFIQFFYQLRCRLPLRYYIGSEYPGDHSAGREVYRFAHEITKHYGYTPAAITQLRVGWYPRRHLLGDSPSLQCKEPEL